MSLLTEKLAISHWTSVEFASALSRQVRMGNLDAAVAHGANSRFEALVSTYFVVLSPGSGDFFQARKWINRFETELKAGDALHLAIASNRGAVAVHSPDKGMIAAGAVLGIPVSAGIAASGEFD